MWDVFIFEAPLKWTDILGCFIIVGVMFIISMGKALGYIK